MVANATLTTSPGVPAWCSGLVHQISDKQQHQHQKHQHPHNQQNQKNCSETPISSFTGNSINTKNTKINKKNTRNGQPTNCIELLEIEMLIEMSKVDEHSFSIEAVNNFFDKIDGINRRIKNAKCQTQLTSNGKQALDIDSTSKSTVMIPIYYQNIRSVPAKEKLYQNLQTTMYDVICLTETWFTAAHKTETFIPSRFTVHRLDRTSSNSEYNRGGGVAILVDTKFTSKRRNQNWPYFMHIVFGLCTGIEQW